MNALRKIESALDRLGYSSDRRLRDYAFADVLSPAGDAREVDLAVFTQLPESFRSAAFGVIAGSSDPAEAIMARRALGAPVFLSIDPNGAVGVWAVESSTRPRLLERIALDQIDDLFARHAEDWSPQALHRAKAQGAAHGAYQLDFVDLGLLPAIESEVQTKLQRVLTEVIGLLAATDALPEQQRAAFRTTFRLLAAKILSDRRHPDASHWSLDDVGSVLAGIETYYHLPTLPQSAGLIDPAKAAAAWAVFQDAVNLRNISADSLAFVYENTLVTADTRKMFGTHSTPRAVAEFVLDAIDLAQFDLDNMRVVEPFAGAGIFLVAALREMKDQLPPDWSAEQRHTYLTARLSGAELDVFACEVATLSLILADYPNANGWKIRQRDLFEKDALTDVLTDATIILCNPPFEDFDQNERLAYPDAFRRSPSKGILALEASLDARPQALGFVLPRGVLLQKQYAKVRQRLAETFEEIELVALPDRIFEKATYPSALIIAKGLRKNDHRIVRLRAKDVRDADREAFLKTGSVSASRTLVRDAANGRLWVSELDEVWSYLETAPRLGDQADIYRGLQWRIQQNGARAKPGPNLRSGVFKPANSLAPFSILTTTWLDFDPTAALYPGPLTRPWDLPKVLINNQRTSRGPWRLAGAFDETGLAASQQFTALWPTDTFSGRTLAAIVNGPLANAYVTEHTTDHDFTNAMLSTLPLPARLDHVALEAAVMAYEHALAEEHQLLHATDEARLNGLLLTIDALVLQGYDLPPRLERRVLDFFDGFERPVRHAFPGWFPSDFKGYMPLHEWLAQTHRANLGGWVTEVFRPLPESEVEALSRFVG
jgi:type I restriction-modification system DNA methylase subunit